MQLAGGRYHVIERIGQGGEGEVFVVRDNLDPVLPVAFKRLNVGDRPELVGFLRGEFQVLSALEHPALARVHDLGTYSDPESGDHLYFTREYLEGRPLEIPEGGQAADKALGVLLDILRALRPLHRSGLVHGDLKPANVMICADGQTRLIDFALAGTLRTGAATLPTGTLRYISPEMLEGRVPDGRGDLYSLGVMLVEMMTGRPLFEGTASEVVQAHLGGQVELPADLDPAMRGSVSDADLRSIVSRLSARDPQHRFVSLDEAEAALMRTLGVREEDPYVRRAPTAGSSARERQREHVLARLGLLASSPSAGALTLLVLGDPGSGRTSFARALRWDLQISGTRVLWIDPGRDGQAAEQVRSIAMQIVWLSRCAGLAIDPAIEQSIADGSIGASHRLRAALTGLARALCDSARLVVIIDDLSMVDAEAARLLRVMGQVSSAHGRPCFVATAPLDASWSLPVLGEGPREDVVLSPLCTADVSSMVRMVVGRDDPRLVTKLEAVAGGNPALTSYYVERAALGDPALDQAQKEPLPVRLSGLWSRRLESVDTGQMIVLTTLAVHGRHVIPSWLADACDMPDLQDRIASLTHLGLLRARSDGSIGLATPAMSRILLGRIDAPHEAQSHDRWAGAIAAANGPEHLVLWHRALAGDAGKMVDEALAAARRLQALGDLAEAEALLGAVMQGRGISRAHRIRLVEALGQVMVDRGRPQDGLFLMEGQGDGSPGLALAKARALASLGQREKAAGIFEGIVKADPAGALAGEALREMCAQLAHLGRHERVAELVEGALQSPAQQGGPAQSELLIARAISLLAQDRIDEAFADATRASRLATEAHDRKLRVKGHWMLAMIHQRKGELDTAAAAYRQAVEICQRTDDAANLAVLQLNLGTLLHRMGEFDEAIDRYLEAMDHGRASGRQNQSVLARINLGSLLALVGQLERAGLEAKLALEQAEHMSQQDLIARSHGLLAEVAARSGSFEDAANGFMRATLMHDTTGNLWEAAETRLELGVALLKKEPADVEGAAAQIERAMEYLEHASSPLLAVKSGLARARLALATGKPEAALGQARRALADCKGLGAEWDDVSWQAFALMAAAHELRGSDLLMARSLKRAAEALEQASLKVPTRFEAGFFAMKERCDVAESVTVTARTAPGAEVCPKGVNGVEQAHWRDTLVRLMDINSRLAATRDPEALLDMILDAAVEFTGAERGMLLMPSGQEGLAVASARDFYQASLDQEHMAFSTSIAREVQNTGEAVITISAMEDDRFGQALSVHELKLQSILCLPIKGRSEVLGVLYLENRLRRGKFTDKDSDLLGSFCDQLAIALTTARLERANRMQRSELEALTEERERLLEKRTRALREARKDLREARSRLAGKNVFRGLVGSTDEMRKVFAVIERVGENDVPVVITGESGTGKEMVARAVHAGMARREGPFVAVNCGALPAELLESELFGHVRGAFTGAVRDKKGVFSLASSGTLLLDEVGDMPVKMQLDLLRVLQESVVRPVGSEKETVVSARVLSATQRPLTTLVREGRFREDLYYRMSVVEIRIPPLRERTQDIPLLIDHFLGAFALRYRTDRKGISRRAVKMLVEHDWPGNVRQLEHALLNAWILTDARVLDVEDFETLGAPVGPRPTQAEPGRFAPIEDEQKRTILDALKASRWNKTEAAALLGVPRRTFYRKLKKYGLLT